MEARCILGPPEFPSSPADLVENEVIHLWPSGLFKGKQKNSPIKSDELTAAMLFLLRGAGFTDSALSNIA